MTKQGQDSCEMRDEYDFSNAIRNPYVQKFQELNLVSLDPDVKAAFPDSRAVNEALRLLIRAAKAADAQKEGPQKPSATPTHSPGSQPTA